MPNYVEFLCLVDVIFIQVMSRSFANIFCWK